MGGSNILGSLASPLCPQDLFSGLIFILHPLCPGLWMG